MAFVDTTLDGKDLAEKFKRVLELCLSTPDKDISPLTALFNWAGKPILMSDHVFFKQMFRLVRPRRRLLKCGRQVGKSFDDTLAAVATQCLVDGFRHLFVTPLHSQVVRLSKEYYGPFLKTSVFRPLRFNSTCVDNELHRTMTNGSAAFFSYAFNNVDRIRGFSNIHEVTIDEVQDMIYDFIAIIGQTMAASPTRGFYTFSGTPKTFDNSIQRLWDDSSQGEWETKCHACGKWNRASADADLLNMIGLETVVCANKQCSKPIYPTRDGLWVYNRPDLCASFDSYHVSQIIHPYHYQYPAQWRELRLKLEKEDEATVYNEILGESKDSASRLVSLEDLRQSCTLGPNTDENAAKHLKDCSRIILAIDWGGGGESGKSTTAVAVLCQKPYDDTIKVVRMIRLSRSLTPEKELAFIAPLFNKYKCYIMAHDHGGGGNVREAQYVTAGIPRERIAPFEYGWYPHGPVVHVRPAVSGSRSAYLMDKSRSLYVLSHMIRGRKVLFPQYETCADELRDFLGLTEEPVLSKRGGDRKIVGRARGSVDDMAHAVNFGCTSLWWMAGAYPDISLPEAYTREPESSEVDLTIQ